MFEFQRSSRRLYTTELKVIRNKSFLKRIQCCNILQSSAQSEAQLKLSLSSIFAVRPESAIRNPPSGIRKSIISNLIIALATTPQTQPLPSSLQPQPKLIFSFISNFSQTPPPPPPPPPHQHHPGKSSRLPTFP